ncbi:MAG: ECF transporter S component [Oscillospiraceae bacterium]|nr:ECF transporter S component [Oscillospiraceae bacterium]
MTTQKKTHKITITAMMAAVGVLLQFLEFPMPFLVPPFVKMDFSELPALLASFSLGPVYGVAVCLLKNCFKLLTTYSGGIGELGNFLMGAAYVWVAGVIYRRIKTRRGALIGSALGSVAMAVASVPINYFITYPFYTKLMPLEAIMEAYASIRPGANGLLQCLLLFNMPFTFVKGILVAAVCFLIYKSLSPLLHR